MTGLVVADPRPKSRRFILVTILSLGMIAGIVCDRLVVTAHSAADSDKGAEVAVARPQSILSRIGDRIVVPPDSPLRTRLAIEAPVVKEVSRMLSLPAVVESDPARTVKVLPPVAGRVIELKVQLGGRVVAGQELAVIDSSDLAQAYSDAEKARSMLNLTKQTLDRLMKLERGAAIAVKDREQAQSDYAQAVSELERSESRLRAIGVPVNPKERSRLLSLKAPITGSVIDLQMAAGAYLNDPTAAVMTLANLDTVWVTANVPEKDISFVSADQPANVILASYPDKVFTGRVLFVSDVIEPDTRRDKVRIAFDNPDKILKPNMFANATLVGPSMTRVMVPNSALLMTNDHTNVFVEVADWAFERRDVEIAYQEGTASAIKTGLKPGERIVVKGGVRLND
jgi:membrane fusion protein, heavy metal efflux system